MGLLDGFRKSKTAPLLGTPTTAMPPAPGGSVVLAPIQSAPPAAPLRPPGPPPMPEPITRRELGRTLPWGNVVAAVGESHYEASFVSICGPKCEDGFDVDVIAELRPEPHNQYDSGAVAVYVEERKVGHLSREDARFFRAIIDQTINKHGYAACDGHIRGGWDRGYGDTGNFGIWLRFSDATIQELSEDEVRLPPGGPVSVSNEERYQENLARAAGDRAVTERGACAVIAALVARSEGNPWTKSAEPVLEVQVDGLTVGFLTPKMSARYLPKVEPHYALGKRVTSEASMFLGRKGGADLTEIRLHALAPESF